MTSLALPSCVNDQTEVFQSASADSPLWPSMYTVPTAVRVPLIAAAPTSLAWISKSLVRSRSSAGLRTVTTRSGAMVALKLSDAQGLLLGRSFRNANPLLTLEGASISLSVPDGKRRRDGRSP